MVTQSGMKINPNEPRFVEATMTLIGKLMLAYHVAQQRKTALRPETPMSQIMASKVEMANPFTKPKQEDLSGVVQNTPPPVQNTANAVTTEALSFHPLETLSVPGNLAQGMSFIP
ncbi:hypothetical protein BDQ17DRAFT_1429495 [Cyathus striatus]|nr:hypothetical protein BDQ17DRAFT_1429495 [Cyathus striatus]